MGTWGSGNLESDGALDTVSELSSELVDKIWKALQSQQSWEADEHEYDELFVHLEWLLSLEKVDLFNIWDMPSPTEFDAVIEVWIAGWGKYFDGLSGKEFKAERFNIIQKTFADFRVICEKNKQMREG